jgi:protein-tyrosine phosphatase
VIDTHCHLLHGLDDGAATLTDSVDLSRSFVDAGVDRILCTPHYSRRFPTDHREALARADELRAACTAAGILLGIAVAAELTPEQALDASPEEVRARRIGEGYILVELTPSTPVISVATVFQRLDDLGLRPIYAHPERCRAVRRDPAVLEGPRRAGALVQVVAPSLLGRWGEEAQAVGWQLVERGTADIVASDAHRLHQRPSLATAADQMATRVGRTRTRDLTHNVPRALLRGEL